MVGSSFPVIITTYAPVPSDICYYTNKNGTRDDENECGVLRFDRDIRSESIDDGTQSLARGVDERRSID